MLTQVTKLCIIRTTCFCLIVQESIHYYDINQAVNYLKIFFFYCTQEKNFEKNNSCIKKELHEFCDLVSVMFKRLTNLYTLCFTI